MSLALPRRALGAVLAFLLTLSALVALSSTASAQPTANTAAAAAAKVFSMLNQERVANHLPKLSQNSKLVSSALTHNKAMSAAQTLSHQLPGEPYFGDRITAAGYKWRAAAENIGYTTQTTTAGAASLQTAMYNEKPPNDGHRRNILSTAVVDVGVSVLIDSHGKLWLTLDFAAPA